MAFFDVLKQRVYLHLLHPPPPLFFSLLRLLYLSCVLHSSCQLSPFKAVVYNIFPVVYNATTYKYSTYKCIIFRIKNCKEIMKITKGPRCQFQHVITKHTKFTIEGWWLMGQHNRQVLCSQLKALVVSLGKNMYSALLLHQATTDLILFL